jgi:transcriptional regulator with XRE-family HTH domain
MRARMDQPDGGASRPRKLKQNKLRYQSRTAIGLCAYGQCLERVEPGHRYCRNDLEAMAKRASRRRRERIAQSLCVCCGARPQFWGVKCIICRQMVAKDPLPIGAKRALRLFREAEAGQRLEQIQADARAAALALLTTNRIQGKRAEALRLYAGIDSGKWRTYREVGVLMNVCVERVRQLLSPSKLMLGEVLSDIVPWRPVKGRDSKGACNTIPASPSVLDCCNDAASIVLGKASSVYEGAGLPNVVLFGLTAYRCEACNRKTIPVPEASKLHRLLARAVLLKSAPMTGQELRFLKKFSGLTLSALAEKLGVTVQTTLTWEQSKRLRYPNDLTVRMVIAEASLGEEFYAEMFRRFKPINERETELPEIKAYWLPDEEGWTLASDVASDPATRRLSGAS